MTSTIPVFLSWHRSLETHSLLMSNLCHTALNDFVTLQGASTYKRTAKEKRFNLCLSVTMLRNHWELELSGWKRGKSETVSFHYTSVTANTTTSYKSRVVYRRISSLTSNMQVSPIVNFSSSIYFFVSMYYRISATVSVRSRIGGAIWRRKELCNREHILFLCWCVACCECCGHQSTGI